MYVTFVPSGVTIVPCIGYSCNIYFSIFIFIQQRVEIKIQYTHIFKGNNLLY